MENRTKLEAALDELLAGKKTEEIVGPGGLLKQLTKALLERAMNAELTNHLGYEKHEPVGRGSDNTRNGKSRKRVQGDFGSVEVAVPPDRNGSLEPKILPKHERRFTGFDDKIISMYARGMTTRDIQAHLEEMYGVEVSATLVSEATEAVMEDVRAWQSRPLEPIYMIVYLDALIVKMRHEGRVDNRAVFVGIGVTQEGSKEELGLWTNATEGAKLWLPDGDSQLRREGDPDRLRGRVERIPGSDPGGVSENGSAVMHRAHGAQQPGVCELERAQAGSRGSQADLPRGDGGRSRAAACRIRSTLGCPVCGDRQDVAQELGRHQSAIRVSGRDPAIDLHHQHR